MYSARLIYTTHIDSMNMGVLRVCFYRGFEGRNTIVCFFSLFKLRTLKYYIILQSYLIYLKYILSKM